MKNKQLLLAVFFTLICGFSLQSCEKDDHLLERPKRELTEGQCPINDCNPDGLIFSCKKTNESLSRCLVERGCPGCAEQGTPPSGRF